MNSVFTTLYRPQVMLRRAPLKRVFDILFSLFLLILLSPLLLLIFFAIRLVSKGPALYSQPRLGRGGAIFTCFKFRTMSVNADELLNELMRRHPELREEWEVRQKLKNDPRIFFLGKILRLTSLDELPQLWNVFKGDISIVGPRPYMVSQRSLLGRNIYDILSVRPGLTGLWQTSGRSSTSFYQRIHMDLQYVNAHSFKGDLILILKTFFVLFFSKNAY